MSRSGRTQDSAVERNSVETLDHNRQALEQVTGFCWVSRNLAQKTTQVGEKGQVKKLHCTHVDAKFKPVPGTEFEIEGDLVLLAMGFVHPVHEGMLKSLDVALDQRGNVSADTIAYQTSIPKVFAAGDMRRGQSLVVWAIREGRQAAHAVDKFLMGTTTLPR